MIKVVIHMRYYITLYLVTKTVTKCDLITPRTVSDNVDLYPNGTATDLDLGKNDKLWLAYINSSIETSFSACWKHIKIKAQMKAMWRCVFHLQPSYEILQHIFSKPCPIPENIFTEISNYWNKKHKETKNLKVNVNIIGKFTTASHTCPDLNTVIKVYKNFAFVFYKFTVNIFLKLNVTFFMIHLVRDEYLQIYFNESEDRIRCYFQKLQEGRRSKTSVISPSYFAVLKFELRFLGEISGMYQIIDTYTVYKNPCFKGQIRDRQTDILFFYMLWKCKIHLNVLWIYVKHYQKMIISLNNTHGIHIHDGPGIHSDQLNHNNSEIHLSSFQAFVVVYTKFRIKTGVHINKYGIRYEAKSIKKIGIHVTNSKSLILPLYLTKNKPVGNEKENNGHFVYHITSDKGYIHLSIKKLTLHFHKIVDLPHMGGVVACSEGGVQFNVDLYGGFKSVCDNYTTAFGIQSMYYTAMSDVVTETRDGLTFIVWSYKHYSSVSVEATVTSTSCMGKKNYVRGRGVEDERVDVLPNHCVTFKTHLNIHCFTNTISQQWNHKLYRKDTAFFDDYLASVHKVKLDMMEKGITLCPYYSSRYVKSTAKACKMPTCEYINNKYTMIQARDHKVKLQSLEIGPFNDILIENEVVEYPSGTDSDFRNPIGTLYLENKDDFLTTSRTSSWMSSTMYHINCSKSPAEIAEWSNLNLRLIDEICFHNKTKLLSYKIAEYHLEPPYPDYKYANIWKLEISLSGCSKNVDNYGHIVFISHVTDRLCNKTRINEISWMLLFTSERMPQCSLKTYTYLHSKLLKHRNVFELGFQKFEAPSIIYYPNVSLKHNVDTSVCKLPYKWTLFFKLEEKYFAKFKSTLKLLHYTDQTFSWKMAAAKCKEYGMTLPHFDSERTTHHFVSYILNWFPLPTYSLFIGLIYKNAAFKWINNNPLIYFSWEPSIITESTHHELLSHSKQLKKITKNAEIYMPNSGKNWNESLWTKVQSMENKTVNYFQLYPNVIQLSAMITSNQTYFSMQCYMLSLFNPIQPHFRSVNCNKKFVSSLICEKQMPSNSSGIPYNVSNPYKRYGFMYCSNGQIISTIFICDGSKDCSDGSDELNCLCFIEGRRINDSIYCSSNCSVESKCNCDTLYTQHQSDGCYSYISKYYMNRQNLNSKEKEKEHKYPCQYSSLKIASTHLNDLLFDCPRHDDEKELLNTTSEKEQICKDKNMNECYPGHSKCYNNEEKCIYNLTTDTLTLMYCRNGKHLQNCESKECKNIWMFKCLDSYCIPYRYVCNGRWDCWNGEDEISCSKYSCINMFKCKHHSTCIHTMNVCDGISDCPLNDDERMCSEMSCLLGCICLNYGISCKGLIFSKIQNTFNTMIHFVFINISNTNIPQDYINKLIHVIFFISQNNNLQQLFMCDPSYEESKLKVLDLSFNKIAKVELKYFSCLPELTHCNLNQNSIADITDMTFEKSSKLSALLLSSNKIKYLCKKTFAGLRNLTLLNIMENNIVFVEHTVFSDIAIKVVLTDQFHVCCMSSNPNSICTARPIWPFSCDALLSGFGLKVITWLLGGIITLLNLTSAIYIFQQLYRTNELKIYDKFVMLINFCDVLVGFYLLTIAITDFSVTNHYVELDIWWRSSIPCHVIAFVSLWSILTEALFLMTVSIGRYRIVKHPFEKPFSKRSIYSVMILLPLLFAILIFLSITVRNEIEGMQNLSSPLCLMLGKIDQSITQTVITVIVPVYLTIIIFITFGFYLKLLSLNNQSDNVLNEAKRKERKKTITRNVVLAGITNAVCWIPVSVFYLVSVILDDFPILIMYWITLVILPINPIMNPIIFHLSNIKDKISIMKAKFKTTEEE